MSGAAFQVTGREFFTDDGRLVPSGSWFRSEPGLAAAADLPPGTSTVSANHSSGDPATSQGGVTITRQRLTTAGPADDFWIVIRRVTMTDPDS